MAPIWRSSTRKHGVPRAEAINAIMNATYSDELAGEVSEGYLMLYIGRPHQQSQRELEVLVHHFGDGREAVVFHVMELGPKFRRYREDNPR